MNVDLLNKVNDRESFLEFVDELIRDRDLASNLEKGKPEDYKFNGANGWENFTIQDFLRASARWFKDIKWKDANPNEITWKKMAEFLYCGKIYE